jgi:hypothetical protein
MLKMPNAELFFSAEAFICWLGLLARFTVSNFMGRPG